MIRSFGSASSSRSAVTASLSFRSGFRDGERYRFLASCWVIVLAPRIRSRRRHGPDARMRGHLKRVADFHEVDAVVGLEAGIFADDHHPLEDGGDGAQG